MSTRPGNTRESILKIVSNRYPHGRSVAEWPWGYSQVVSCPTIPALFPNGATINKMKATIKTIHLFVKESLITQWPEEIKEEVAEFRNKLSLSTNDNSFERIFDNRIDWWRYRNFRFSEFPRVRIKIGICYIDNIR